MLLNRILATNLVQFNLKSTSFKYNPWAIRFKEIQTEIKYDLKK